MAAAPLPRPPSIRRPGDATPRTADRHGVQHLRDNEAATIVEVLPRPEYDWAHLPGAVHLPLRRWEVGHVRLVQEITSIDLDDGVVFDTGRLTTQQIREHDLYAGGRVVVPATVDRAQQPLRVDVNVGDPVTPALQEIAYPALLGDPFPLVGYPVETVLAEKLVTAVALGDTTTRERDFADLLLLTGTHTIDAAVLLQAIAATAGHRQTPLRPLREVLTELGARRQADWQRYLTRAGLADRLPGDYATAIESIAAFADPIWELRCVRVYGARPVGQGFAVGVPRPTNARRSVGRGRGRGPWRRKLGLRNRAEAAAYATRAAAGGGAGHVRLDAPAAHRLPGQADSGTRD